MANVVVNSAKKKILDGDIDFLADSFKVMFLTSSYTPNIDTDEFIDDISANEVAASGTYSAGGVSLASITTTVDTTNDRAYVDASDFSVTGFTGSFRYIALYKNTGTPSTSAIVGIYDLGSTVSPVAGTFSGAFAAPGSGAVLYLS